MNTLWACGDSVKVLRQRTDPLTGRVAWVADTLGTVTDVVYTFIDINDTVGHPASVPRVEAPIQPSNEYGRRTAQWIRNRKHGGCRW